MRSPSDGEGVGDARGRATGALAARIGNVLALLLAVLVGSALRIRRRHVEESLARAGFANPSRLAREMYGSLARGLLELLHTLVVDPNERLANEFPWSRIDALRGGSGGFVVATAHTGNWDLVACAIASRAPLTVVSKRLSVRSLDRVWQWARRRRGVRLAHVGTAARIASRALRTGEAVAMMIDQAPERCRAATQVEFLGAPAWVDLAPALCAMRARAPLVVAFPLRLDHGEHTVEIADILVPPKRPRREWAVEAMTSATRALERFVRAHPEQWLWMHRRWKDLPATERAGSAAGMGRMPHPRAGSECQSIPVKPRARRTRREGSMPRTAGSRLGPTKGDGPAESG